MMQEREELMKQVDELRDRSIALEKEAVDAVEDRREKPQECARLTIFLFRTATSSQHD
jgi:hypothetical protein